MLGLKEFNGPKNLNLKNKIVMAPMCMYQSNEYGLVNSFHKTHYGARALGGVGLIIIEATAIDSQGKISQKDLGIWNPGHINGLRSLVEEVHSYGSKIGIQLNHAGRKAKVKEGEALVSASSIPFNESSKVPQELTKEEIDGIINKFKDGAKRASDAGFDVLEIHAAHGYLIHQFLSPLSNRRTDAYGGSVENRSRFLKEVLTEVKRVWPPDKAILIRVSADDYVEGGIDIDEMIQIINNVKPFIDMVHVSTGGIIETDMPTYSGYQIGHADAIKEKCDIPTIGVGLINSIEQIEEILEEDRVDLIALGRALLRDPNFILNEAFRNDFIYEVPKSYERAYIL